MKFIRRKGNPVYFLGVWVQVQKFLRVIFDFQFHNIISSNEKHLLVVEYLKTLGFFTDSHHVFQVKSFE